MDPRPAPAPEGRSPLDDAITRQYERWVYPEPLQDLAQLGGGHDFSDPILRHRLYWPDRECPQSLDILVAGCGANQAAIVAYRNPGARVLGIDVSEPSLANERHLRHRHKLENLELLRLPIEDAPTLGREFDLVIAAGVLHHMSDPLVGLRALGKCLRRDGVMSVFLYGRYGRIGIELMQDLFRRLGLPQDEPSVALVKQVLSALPPEHPLAPVRHTLGDTDFDAGVVDTFLNARDRSYTAEECLRFVDDAGLAFQGWIHNARYHAEGCIGSDHPLYPALSRLDIPDVWIATDLYLCNPKHVFMVCRPDRPAAQYRIDFASPGALGYVPLRRAGVEVQQPDRAAGLPARLRRADWETVVTTEQERLLKHVAVTDAQAVLLNHADGRRSIRDIAAAAGSAGLRGAPAELEIFALNYFRTLWRMDMIAIKLGGA